MTDACPFGLCDGSGFVVDEARNVAMPCRCRAQRVSRARAQSLSAAIPKRYRGVSFDRPPVTEIAPAIVRAVRIYVRDIEGNLDRGRGIAFMGDVGTGKTTLAMLVAKAALEAGRSVAIYSLPRLLAQIRRTYDDDSAYTDVELLERLARVDLLHLDDVGAEKTSPWVLEQLYSIINTRYEDGRAVVFTTNLTQPGELAEQIGDRTASRLREICGDPLPLFGADKRFEDRGDPDAAVSAPAPAAVWGDGLT